MAKFCSNCGNEITGSETFCTECGTPVTSNETKTLQTETDTKQESKAPQESAQPTYTASPSTVYRSQPLPLSEKSGIIGTGYFFGMMFLYSIPVVGWLVCIITAFVPKNETKKNFAKAMLIWLIIGLVLSVIGYFIVRGIGGMITGYINNELGSQFSDLTEIFDLIK